MTRLGLALALLSAIIAASMAVTDRWAWAAVWTIIALAIIVEGEK